MVWGVWGVWGVWVMPTGRASSINMVMKERDSTRWDKDVRDKESTANEEKKLGQRKLG